MMGGEDYVHVLGETYHGKWIALSEDESRIVGVGDTMREAVVSAARNGVSEPVLIKMPSNWKFEGSKYIH